MRALVAASLLLAFGHPVLQAPRENPALAQLAMELSARRGPGPWGETDGPLVRDRLAALSEAMAQEEAAWSADFVKRLDAVPSADLTHEDWITWSLLRWEGEMGAARGGFFWHEVPIAPYTSPLRNVTAGFAAARLQSEDGRARYLDGLHQLSVLGAQIEAKLRGQAARGIVLPAAQVDAVVPFLRSFAAPGPGSPFAIETARLETVPPDARAAFSAAVGSALADLVSPAFARLAAYVDGPYRARASSEVGLGRYPGGDKYYRLLVRQHTGLDLTPGQVHEIGLQEVARLERELDGARQQAGFAGSLAGFRAFLKSDRRFFPERPEQMGEALMAAASRIEPRLSHWFSERPKAPYGARRLAPALEPLMTYGYYQIPTRQDPKGYYLFNGSRLEERSLLNAAALSYHELVPGHHFQLAMTLENQRLSPFRRNAMYTAFTEGWGEYASDLAGEMGMYADPYDRAGRLAMDLFLSTRLVVDTGMNALGWSRERAMQFMREHTLESDTQIATETLRYAADMPGQALAYKLGSRSLRALRERMRAKLGASFDIRRFHQAVLGHGSMPLAVLDAHVERALAPAR
jgi:uncharacterized protein (DUF885 family)